MTSPRTLVKWGIAAVVAVVLVLGGIMAAMAVATAQRGGTVVVLMGLSPSELPVGDLVDKCAMHEARQAIEDGADLIILPIGRSPAQLRTTAIHAGVDLWSRMNASGFAKKKKQLRAYAAARVRQVREGPEPDGASDVIAAASIAGNYLDEAKEPRRLVVCGDAHQVGAINLYETNQASCSQLLKAAAADLSNLTRVNVVFATPGADDPHHLPLPEEQSIERFWKQCWGPAVHPRSLEYRHGEQQG
jgi:hypothetical protein